MATIMSHNLPLIPLPLKASAAALAKAGLMMPGPAGLLGGSLGLPEPQRSPPAVGAGSKLDETDETDRMSCCSDDSELSVGQEVPDDLRAPTAATTTEEMSNDSSRYSKDAGSELDFVRLHQHPQNQPPGMLRPSPTRLHEEFLRNSQLYAEELMRQQMQIVAAARGLAMTSPSSKSPLEAMANSPVGLVTARNLHQELHRSRSPLQGFRPARDAYRPDSSSSPANEPPAGAATGSGSFRGLHSHLSAISAITQNLNSDLSKLTSPTAFAAGSARTSRESSQSPPTANGLHQLHQQQQHQQQQQYHQQHYLNQQYPPHHHHHHHHHQLALAALNNNIANALHDQSLKFSIDNILKADFGRRITDPLLLKRTPKSAPSGRKANDKTPSAIDLSGAVAGCQQQQQQQQQQESSALVSTSGTSTSNNLSVTVSKGFCPQRSSSSSSSSRASSGSVSSVGSVGSEDVVSPMSPLSSTGSLKGEGGGGGGGNSGSSATASANSATNGSSGGAGASGTSSSSGASASGGGGGSSSSSGPMVWPAWVYCTRYSDRPSSGPRTRKPKKSLAEKGSGGVQAAGSGGGSGGGGGNSATGSSAALADDKRPRTAFSGPQLARLKHEFAENRYLTERRRQQLSAELGLNEAQIKIWFQNKRAKIKKSSGHKNPLALQLMAQGLYNHSTVPLTREEEELQEMQAAAAAAAESRTGSAGPAAAAAAVAAAAAASASG